MTKNTLSDLNNHLFEQLERVNDNELTDDELKKEIIRSKAVSGLAKSIIENGALVLEAHKINENRLDADNNIPKMLKGDK